MTSKILFTALAVLCVSISSYATPIPNASIGGFDIIYDGEYFTSDENLTDASGEKDPLPFGDGYTNFTNLFEIGYSMRPGFRISGGGEFAFATSDGTLENRSNSEFTNLILSGQYFIGTGKFRAVPNFRASIAMNEIERFQDEVITSEGSSQYEFGSWFRYPLWVLDNYFYVAYVYSEDDKADLLKWALGTKWTKKSIIVRGQLNGVSTVADDAQTDFIFNRRTDTNNQTSAGSLRYNSINPSYIEFETTVEYQTSPTMRFGGGLGHTITGKNYGYGLSILLTFTTEFAKGDGEIEDAYRLDGSGNFQPELEEYDEDLFR